MLDQKYRIEMLGGLCIRQGDRTTTRFRTYKAGALLARLAYFLKRTHPREEIIELFWPDAELDAGRNSLRAALTSLRHQLEPPGVRADTVLQADRANVRLNPEAVSTDVAEFAGAIQKAVRAGELAEKIRYFTHAVELYGGELLLGYYEEWVVAERERLAEAYRGVLRQLTTLLEKQGDPARAIDFALRALSADPWNEQAHCDLIRLYLAAGRRADAERQVAELKETLRKEFDSDPSEATTNYLC